MISLKNLVEEWLSYSKFKFESILSSSDDLKTTRGPAAKTETVAMKRVKKEDD
jgi:hypothetical protein